MKIVLYSTTTQPEGTIEDRQDQRHIPDLTTTLKKTLEKYPDDEVIVMTQMPGVYLADIDMFDQDQVVEFPSHNLTYKKLEKDASPEEIANLIAQENPDIAIPVNLPIYPVDWNFLNDSVIAEKLEDKGIKTLANDLWTNLAFADKWRSRLFFRSRNLPIANGLYVNGSLLSAEQDDPDMIAFNPYRNYIEHRIDSFNYPVIFKDTTGASSFGMSVAHNPEEAKQILSERQDRNDFLIEEMIQGELFGTEVYGSKGNYTVLPPLRLSVNDEGISDATLNIKFGPITDEKYNLDELNDMLTQMAEDLGIVGSFQVDLIFKDGKWNIIEVNPRLSGMSFSESIIENRTIYDRYMDLVHEPSNSNKDYTYILNIKPKDFTKEELEELVKQREHVKYALILAGLMSEIIIGADEPEQLLEELIALRELYPDNISEGMVKAAQKMIESN